MVEGKNKLLQRGGPRVSVNVPSKGDSLNQDSSRLKIEGLMLRGREFLHLSDEECKEKRLKGLCFTCD